MTNTLYIVWECHFMPLVLECSCQFDHYFDLTSQGFRIQAFDPIRISVLNFPGSGPGSSLGNSQSEWRISMTSRMCKITKLDT